MGKVTISILVATSGTAVESLERLKAMRGVCLKGKIIIYLSCISLEDSE